MQTGIVMCFSTFGDKAVIWCDAPARAPLAHAHRMDFPLSWPHIEIGSLVRILTRGGGRAERVVALLVPGCTDAQPELALLPV